MLFKSLKKEILFFTLGITILTILITTALGASSTQTAGYDAQNATGHTLREQAKASLIQITEVSAKQQDLVFQQTRDDAIHLASYTINLFDNPSIFPSNSYWKFDSRVEHIDGKYLNKSTDISTIFIPNFATVDSTLKRNLELTSYLDFIVPSILASNHNQVAIYAISTKGVSRYFPNIILGSVVPPDYDSTQDIVYTQGIPNNNPEKKVVWSPLYDDPAERGLMITATAPIYTKVGFAGVLGIDVLLNDIIANIISYSPVEGSYAFLIDKKGEAIAFPDKAYQDILGRSRNPKEVRTDLASSSPEFLSILKDMVGGSSGFGSIHSKGREIFIAYAPLHQTGFSLGVVAEASVMLKAAETLKSQITDSVRNNIVMRVIPAGSLLIIIASFISYILITRITKPVQELTRGAREIGKGNFDNRLNISSKNEIGELAETFTEMSQDLKKSHQELFEYSQGLEKKVDERTREISEINHQQEGLLHFISHEIKGFLTKGQNAFAGIVEGDYGSVSPDVKTLATGALSEMRKGVSTVMDILDASNLKKGTITYDKKPFDIKATVESAVKDLRVVAEEKGLELLLEVAEGNYLYNGDEAKLRRHVFRNLIDNAIRYTLEGKISVYLTNSTEKITFSVKDTGVGISDEDKTHLFTEGGHGKNSIKVNVDSTGYGLFVAKQVTGGHGGVISAHSEGPGTGSTFIVELPVA